MRFMIKDEFVTGRFTNVFSGNEIDIGMQTHFEMEKWDYLVYYKI